MSLYRNKKIYQVRGVLFFCAKMFKRVHNQEVNLLRNRTFGSESYFQSGPKVTTRYRQFRREMEWTKSALAMAPYSFGRLSNLLNFHFWSRFEMRLSIKSSSAKQIQ